MRLPDLPTSTLLFLITLIPGLFLLKQVEAQTYTNNDSSIILEDIDIAPTNTPRPSPGTRRSLPIITGQTIPSPSPIPAPLEVPAEKVFLMFSLAQSDVDFGPIDPTNPVIRTHQISLQSGNAQRVSLFAYENHPLKMTGNEIVIPDTTCDDGKCSQSFATPWENTLTYGFAFRCDGVQSEDVCHSDFSNQQNYRQFADVAKDESGTQLLNNSWHSDSFNARITYKVNIPGTQEKGTYTNSLVFIAAPTF